MEADEALEKLRQTCLSLRTAGAKSQYVASQAHPSLTKPPDETVARQRFLRIGLEAVGTDGARRPGRQASGLSAYRP
jgi:hypothetical protein